MRRWNAYELTQLLKNGIDPDQAAGSFPQDMPVEYITGKVNFCGREFFVNQSTLIPRPETEELVQLALSYIDEQDQPLVVIEIGTGSGAIGLSILLATSNIAKITITDISKAALAVAQKNADCLIGDKSRLLIQHGDLLEIQPSLSHLDLIVANLPYIPTKRLASLDSNVKDYEPYLALDGGNDGLELIRKLLNQAKSYLKPGGVVMFEVDDTHTDVAAFTDWEIEVKVDSNGKIRFWIARLR